MGSTYLVECYWPGVTADAIDGAGTRADRAARELCAAGHDVRFLGCVLVPSDEVAFCLFTGDTRSSVEVASRRAALPFERVMECVTTNPRLFDDPPPGDRRQEDGRPEQH